MFDGERLFKGITKTMEAYFAQGDVKVFKYQQTRMMVTEINLADAKISVVRYPMPQIIPGTYGEILVETGNSEIIFPIKRTLYEKPDYIIEQPSGEVGVLGRVTGQHLDLALAYNLGVSDQALSEIVSSTVMQEAIPNKIAELVLT